MSGKKIIIVRKAESILLVNVFHEKYEIPNCTNSHRNNVTYSPKAYRCYVPVPPTIIPIVLNGNGAWILTLKEICLNETNS